MMYLPRNIAYVTMLSYEEILLQLNMSDQSPDDSLSAYLSRRQITRVEVTHSSPSSINLLMFKQRISAVDPGYASRKGGMVLEATIVYQQNGSYLISAKTKLRLFDWLVSSASFFGLFTFAFLFSLGISTFASPLLGLFIGVALTFGILGWWLRRTLANQNELYENLKFILKGMSTYTSNIRSRSESRKNTR